MKKNRLKHLADTKASTPKRPKTSVATDDKSIAKKI